MTVVSLDNPAYTDTVSVLMENTRALGGRALHYSVLADDSGTGHCTSTEDMRGTVALAAEALTALLMEHPECGAGVLEILPLMEDVALAGMFSSHGFPHFGTEYVAKIPATRNVWDSGPVQLTFATLDGPLPGPGTWGWLDDGQLYYGGLAADVGEILDGESPSPAREWYDIVTGSPARINGTHFDPVDPEDPESLTSGTQTG